MREGRRWGEGGGEDGGGWWRWKEGKKVMEMGRGGRRRF